MPTPFVPPLERFLARITVARETGCWEWSGVRRYGYGFFSVDGRNQMVHRFAYIHYVGPIPAGLDLDHLCRNRCCANPAHLEPVTRQENLRRSPLFPASIRAAQRVSAQQRRDAQTCKLGHPYYSHMEYGKVRRRCRECTRARVQARTLALKGIR